MKIGISTLAFRTWSLEEIIAPCVKAGYQALEIRMDFHEWSHISLPDSHFEQVNKTIKEAGLEVTDLGSSVHIYNYEEKSIADMRRLFEICTILGAKGVRIMLQYNPKAEPTEEDYQGILKWLLEVDAIAGEFNKETWIETHGQYSTGKKVAKIFEDIKLSNTKVIWDFMHSLEQGETIEETMELLFKYTVHTHLKDGYRAPDHANGRWKHSKLGGGEVPNQYFVELLQGAGYDGYYSLEWESAWRQELRDLECDEEQVAFYPTYMRMFDTKKA